MFVKTVFFLFDVYVFGRFSCIGRGSGGSSLTVKNLGEGHYLVRVNTNRKYLLLPVEEAMPDVRVSMIAGNREVKAADVRLAVNRVDYFVPLDLSGYAGKDILVKFKLSSNDPCGVNFRRFAARKWSCPTYLIRITVRSIVRLIIFLRFTGG